MNELQLFNVKEFQRFNERKFNKQLLTGAWLVWRADGELWAEWNFDENGRFYEFQSSVQKAGHWLYLPDLQLINLSFFDADSENLNLFFWYVTHSETVIFTNYENQDEAFYLIKKDLFSDTYQQTLKEIGFATFISDYKNDVLLQNNVENKLIEKKLGFGCAVFAALAVAAVYFDLAVILSWFILGIIYVIWGQEGIRRQLNQQRLNSNFNPVRVLGLMDINARVNAYFNKKLLYGFIGIAIIVFITIQFFW